MVIIVVATVCCFFGAFPIGSPTFVGSRAKIKMLAQRSKKKNTNENVARTRFRVQLHCLLVFFGEERLMFSSAGMICDQRRRESSSWGPTYHAKGMKADEVPHLSLFVFPCPCKDGRDLLPYHLAWIFGSCLLGNEEKQRKKKGQGPS